MWQSQPANVQVDAGARISADGQGYVGRPCAGSGAGPGGGPPNCNNAGNGGSYGGQGGGPDPASTYGSDLPLPIWVRVVPAATAYRRVTEEPPAVPAAAHPAGGLETLTNNGIISANGVMAPQWPGGGSGGSIYVTTGTLAGNGTFNANGGATSHYTGGGGGRIAVYYTDGATTGISDFDRQRQLVADQGRRFSSTLPRTTCWLPVGRR